MARLLAAEIEAAAHHLLDDVAVADLSAPELDAYAVECQLQSEIAHDGGNDGAAPQRALFGHLFGADREHVVPVDDLAVLVDENRPIGVAVERHAEIGAVLEHRLPRGL